MKKIILSGEVFEKFLIRIAKLTDANNHTEARILIAKYFDTYYYQKLFNGIESICEGYGSLPAEIETFRNRMTFSMLSFIADEFGAEIAKEVKSKL